MATHKKPDEAYARTRDRELAGNALRFHRENWTLPEHLHHKPGKTASACSGDSDHNKITGYMSLYKVGPKVYRAGLSLAAEPESTRKLKYEKSEAAKYSRFVLIGSYATCRGFGRVF